MKCNSCLLVFAAALLPFSATWSQSPAARIVIRGDDMGFSHSGNLALIKCYKEGIERSIEVIVASPWFPEAVKLLQQEPGVDVGVHLAITSEWENVKWRPLTDCPSLRDSSGYFRPMVFPNPNYPGQSIQEKGFKIGEIEREFRAQIELAIRKIPWVSHVSAHMGCTSLSREVEAMAKRLAQEYRIDIDLADYGVPYVGYSGPNGTVEEKIESFIHTLDTLKPGKTYLFLDHPGLDDEELRAVWHIGYEHVAADRQGVTDLFTSERVGAFIKKKGIRVISYKELAEGGKIKR